MATGKQTTQFLAYSYGSTNVYGTNVIPAQSVTKGSDIVGVIDISFYIDPIINLDNLYVPVVPTPTPILSPHGTAVASVITGSPGGNGPDGLAPSASLDLFPFGAAGLTTATNTTIMQTAAIGLSALVSDGALVVNNSWTALSMGVGSPALSGAFDPWLSAVSSATTNGRHGLGTSIIFAAGNYAQSTFDGKPSAAPFDNVSLDPYKDDPQIIVVASSEANGTVSPWSTEGSANTSFPRSGQMSVSMTMRIHRRRGGVPPMELPFLRHR